MENILNLKGRIALITGAGQGVGRQTAIHFAVHGCDAIIVNDFVRERAEAVADELKALGCRAEPMPVDITDFERTSRRVEELTQILGGLHILVNNAGNAGPEGTPDKFPPFWETEPEDWDKWMGTNLFGVLNLCRAALPIMIKSGGGSIVNVVSDAGRVGEPHLAVYSAAKAGTAGFSRALAKGLGIHKIRVNSVSLSTINTPGVQSMLPDEATIQKMLRSYIIRRMGQPSDAANMILFLASNAASWITGQTYPVNGGYSVS